jgi:copper transport protein
VALVLALPAQAFGHAVLVESTPPSGATLGAAPPSVTLTLTERPEAALSEIEVLGARGAAFRRGPVEENGEVGLTGRLRPLPKGVYTVRYRVVSAVDGHTSTGAFAFGVGVSPAGARLPQGAASAPTTSTLEVVARWLLLGGLVLMLGVAVAGAAGFGREIRLATAGWLFAAAGLLLLAEAQRRSAGASLADLLDTEVGEALVQRAAAIAAAGVALLLAVAVGGRVALGVTAAAALVAIVAHVSAGHAAAGSWPSGVTIAAQSAHFAAAGVWIGGLACLLVSTSGAPAVQREAAMRRYVVAVIVALAVVLVTGTLRAIDELTAVGDLFSTGYGRAVLAKILLFGVLIALGLRRRWRIELGVAAAVLATAALLGALAPPVDGQAAARQSGLADTGEAGGVTVRLAALSPLPGPNVFRAEVEGGADAATLPLRFTPLDDPGDPTTRLALTRTGDGTYEGAGANLKYDGRWGVEASVGGVTVPLELDVPGKDTFATITRPPGEPTSFAKTPGGTEFVQITLFPERAGPSHITANGYDDIAGPIPIASLVLTMQAGDGPVRQLPVRRDENGTFATDVDLPEGDVTFAVVLHTQDGRRLRRTFDVKLSAGS